MQVGAPASHSFKGSAFLSGWSGEIREARSLNRLEVPLLTLKIVSYKLEPERSFSMLRAI